MLLETERKDIIEQMKIQQEGTVISGLWYTHNIDYISESIIHISSVYSFC